MLAMPMGIAALCAWHRSPSHASLDSHFNVTGHLSDHSVYRCRLQEATGDAMHALSFAAQYQIRRLLRAIGRLGRGRLPALTVLISYATTSRRLLVAGPTVAA